MNRYIVRWEIDIEADDPIAAAREALEIQRDSTSTATCFDVHDDEGNPIRHVDLGDTNT